MDKSSFLIYLDYEEQFNLLTDEQAGQLIKAIIKYEKTREYTELDGIVKMAFSFIKTQLDKDREKWEETCKARSEAGKKGANNRWNNKNSKSITEDSKNSKAKIEMAKMADNEYENESEYDNEEEIEDDKTVCPYQEILTLYHSICTSYPKIRSLSKTRKQAIKARFNEYKKDVGVFKELFEKAENSSFLKGSNSRNWNANFDWLMNANNMSKVLEGNYKNKNETMSKQPTSQRQYDNLDFLYTNLGG